MLADFVALVSEIFPSVDPGTAARCLRELSRGSFDPKSLFCVRVFESLTQGDLVEPVRFIITDDDGQELYYSGPGILLSNSCDAEHDEHVIFAACYPLEAFVDAHVIDELTIRSNRIFNLLYLPLLGPNQQGLIADLSLLQSHSRSFISSSLIKGTSRKICSLSEWGFYLLLAKLSVHLLRPEAAEVTRGRI